MNTTFSLLDNSSGDGDSGGGAPSDGSTTGESILTTKNNHDMGISVEVSSPLPLDQNLDLGLGLSISGSGLKYGRILTAKDFPSTFGASRIASDSDSVSSVVGWPPIRKGYKLANKTKSPDEQSRSTPQQHKTIGNELKDICSETKKGFVKNGYLTVKVNMDGTLIGRKVDLNAHSSYETLAQTLEDMFGQKRVSTEAKKPSKLLDATSEFVLTYEDKDGDCMLVGDVPWQMFLNSVKRLRIIRNSESSKIGDNKCSFAASTCQEKNTRRRTDDI